VVLSGTGFRVGFLLTRLLVFGLFKGEEVLAELLNYWLVERGSVSYASLATTQLKQL
jgi:pheromone shutdown protein TraB